MTIGAAERRAAVRERYASAAIIGGGCCGPSGDGAPADAATATVGDGCCSPTDGGHVSPGADPPTADEISCAVGYDESELTRVPEGANLGLGLSSDPDRWVVRPEFGFLRDPGEEGTLWHWSVGFTFFPDAGG